MRPLLLSFALVSPAVLAGDIICTDGPKTRDPQNVSKEFSGTIFCRRIEDNAPTENLTYRNGVLIQRHQYQEMQLRWLVEYFDNGKLKSETSYSAAGLHGPKREYTENGKLTEEEMYENGQRRSHKEYDDNGVLKLARTYSEKGQDESVENYENGKLIRRVAYENGVVKKSERLDEKGTVIAETSKDNNKVFYPSGKLKADNFYQDGDLIGARHYTPDGKLDEITIYADSKVASEVSYHSDGSLRNLTCDEHAKGHETLGKLCGFKGPIDVTLKDETGKSREGYTYLNGKMVTRKTYSDGRLTGEFPADSANGSLEGIRKTFHPNGKLATESHYKNNERVLAKQFYENGNLKEVEAATERGVATSSARYDEEGRLTKVTCKKGADQLPDFKNICEQEGTYEYSKGN